MSLFDHTNLVIQGGTFTQHNTTIAQSTSAFERLQQAVAPGAFHNSGERFDPPKCHPRTRRAVIGRIRNWILGKESTNSLIMWLNGSAGGGKSAIAQTIAELCYKEGILLASFFFSKSDSHRNHAKPLFPTLAYQLACAIPDARAQVEQGIARDPLIFTRSLEAQMVTLLVEPLQTLAASTTVPRLVIIDGLDEVLDACVQTKILEVIANGLQQHRMPLIFLIASRPEQQISFAFSSESLSQFTHHLRLDDTFHPDDDIRLFLDDSLSKIKDTHPRKNYIPSYWPSEDVINNLVYKASGQFIYASTVIRFVQSIRHRPTDRLEIVLGLRPVQHDLPFAELDALYMHILSNVEYPDRTMLIIGTLLHWSNKQPNTAYYDFCYRPDIKPTIRNLEWFLGLNAGDVELLLADMSSLILLEGNNEDLQEIRILHASFPDFLFDATRSGRFKVDRKEFHAEAACRCFQHLKLRWQPQNKDWHDQRIYLLNSILYNLSMTNTTPNLMEHLKDLSLDHLLEDLDIATLRPRGGWNDDQIYFGYLFWFYFIPKFISVMQTLVPEESESQMLWNRNYDQVMEKELDIHYEKQASVMPFLICLLVCDSPLAKGHVGYGNILQLTNFSHGWITSDDKSPRTSFDPIDLLFYHESLGVFEKYLLDASRSKSHALDAGTYATASLSCLKYVTSCHLAIRIDLQHTRRHLAIRRNSPLRWRWLMKYLNRLHVKNSVNAGIRLSPMDLQAAFPKLVSRRFKQRPYMDAMLLGLTFLPKSLNKSTKSKELIALASAEKSFSQRAFQFPDEVKKCKVAIAAYLERVGDKTMGAEGDN